MLGGQGAAPGLFRAPFGVAVAEGCLVVSESVGARVQVLTLRGLTLTPTLTLILTLTPTLTPALALTPTPTLTSTLTRCSPCTACRCKSWARRAACVASRGVPSRASSPRLASTTSAWSCSEVTLRS